MDFRHDAIMCASQICIVSQLLVWFAEVLLCAFSSMCHVLVLKGIKRMDYNNCLAFGGSYRLAITILCDMLEELERKESTLRMIREHSFVDNSRHYILLVSSSMIACTLSIQYYKLVCLLTRSACFTFMRTLATCPTL